MHTPARSHVLALFSAAALAASGVATAAGTLLGPTPYLSTADSPFLGLQGFQVETFESGALTLPGVTASPGIFTSPGAQTDSVDADGGPIDGSGTTGRSYLASGVTTLTFTFSPTRPGGLPTHAGIVWTDVGEVFLGEHGFGTGPVTFEAFDALGTSLGTAGAVLGDGAITGATAEDRFFGAINAGGISRIVISMSNSPDWEVDHLQVATIPEPSAWLMMGAGLALAGFAAARRRDRG